MRLAQITSIPAPGRFNNYDSLAGDVVSRILLFAIGFSGFLFLYQLIVAGYTYLTSLGDPGKIQSATKQLINASTGLLIVISVFFLGQIIELLLGINFI